jgi:hypothetical protein
MTAIEILRHGTATIGPASPLGTRLRGIAQSVWSALERAGQRRAQRELAVLSQWHAASDPALAEQLRLAAAELAAGADRVRSQENPQ